MRSRRLQRRKVLFGESLVPELLIKDSAFSMVRIVVAPPHPAEATERCPIPDLNIITDTPGLYPCSFVALKYIGNKPM